MPHSINRLIIATHNQGKLGEFRDLLGDYIPEIIGAGELKLPSPQETGVTCQQNALLKLNMAARILPKDSFILADDSGFFIKALGDQPGVYAADWLKPDPRRALQNILQKMAGVADRSAYFLCVLALRHPNGKTVLFEGRADGHIADRSSGADGFGYDPIFIPQGETLTFTALPAPRKNALSHRGLATRMLIKDCLQGDS